MSDTVLIGITLVIVILTVISFSTGMRYVFSAKVERDLSRTGQPADNPERNLRRRPLIGGALLVSGLVLFGIAASLAWNVITR
jgi:hypothetical protein